MNIINPAASKKFQVSTRLYLYIITNRNCKVLKTCRHPPDYIPEILINFRFSHKNNWLLKFSYRNYLNHLRKNFPGKIWPSLLPEFRMLHINKVLFSNFHVFGWFLILPISEIIWTGLFRKAVIIITEVFSEGNMRFIKKKF